MISGSADGWLARIPLFAGFEVSDLAAFAELLQTEAVSAGDVVVRQGEKGDALFVVVSGQLRVVSDVPKERVLLAHLGPGEFFGERALLTGELRNAAVVADVDSAVIRVPRQLFQQYFVERPENAGRIRQAMERRAMVSGPQHHNEAWTLTALPDGTAEFVLGRAESCTFQLDAPGVADRHAAFSVDAGVWKVTDLGSAAGTFVNKARVETAIVTDGDVVRLGAARIFVLDGVLKCFIPTRGARIETHELRRLGSKGREILKGITVTFLPGELVAIVGPSGAGKTTLLQSLVGLQRPQSGDVTYDGIDLYANLARFRQQLGYVPQYDTLHVELSVHQSLRYTGRLRLSTAVDDAELEDRIAGLLKGLHLDERATTRVGSLSGGQRKRTCVAAELLSDPGVLCLDEPTSGLDPGLDLDLMLQLRELADEGRTVILTTHATRNIRVCDQVVILSDGQLVFAGPPADALLHFGVDDFVDVYAALAATPAGVLAEQFSVGRTNDESGRTAIAAVASRPLRSPSVVRQYSQLLQRDTRVLLSDRVNTVLRVAGAPVLALLVASTFDSHIFALERASGGNVQQAITLLYLSAAICLFLGAFTSANVITRETGIYQRERLVSLSPLAYVLSKASVLAVFSLTQGVLFIAVLEARIAFPGGWTTGVELAAALGLVSLAGMAMGLAISSLSVNSDRAAILVVLALIPQLVFAGSTVPRSEMTTISKAISDVTVTKWALELSGQITDLDARVQAQSVVVATLDGGDSVVLPLPVRPFENAFKGDPRVRWEALVAFAVLFLGTTIAVQYRKT